MSSRGRKKGSPDAAAQLPAGSDGAEPARGGSGRRTDGPSQPEGWRDLINSDYDYPSDLDDLGRRDRRHAKKAWRRDDHAQRMAWLREQRRAEPVSPASILVVVVLLGVLVLGIGGGLPRILGSDEDRQPVGLLTPADPLPLPTTSGDSPSSVPSEPATANVTTPPVQTNGPPPSAVATSNEVVGAWARTFYTRDPLAQSYDQLVDTASRYMTPEMASSFETQGDSTYDALRADGGKSTVVSAVVSAPKEGTAPTDTPERVSRFVNVVIDITGKNPQRITVPLLVTVVLQGTTWLISDVDGGEGI